MIIERDIKIDGNFLPEIVNIVNSVPDAFLYHEKYLLRHPKIIVYRSLTRIFKAFYEINKESKNIQEQLSESQLVYDDQNSEDITTKLADLVLELLESIISHIEDCLYIFKCTTPFNSTQEKFVSRWLEKVKHSTYRNFYDSIKDYRDEISLFVNKVKHEHGRLKIMIGFHKQGNIIGYYIKNIEDTENGVKEVLDLNKVKTLVPDLKFHFYNVYYISNLFSSALIDSLKIYQSAEINIARVESNINKFEEIVKTINDNDFFVFPSNEIFSPKVFIHFDIDKLLIEYPVGVTQENKKFTIASAIKGMQYPLNQVILVPTKKALKELNQLDVLKEGTQIQLTDAPENFRKIFYTHEWIYEGDKSYDYIILDYVSHFKIKTYTNMACSVTFIGGIDSETFVKVFNVDYLGMKLTKNKN